MITLEEFLEVHTEGADASGYDVVVDIGDDMWIPDTDEPFIEFDHSLRRAFIKRRRVVINPRSIVVFR